MGGMLLSIVVACGAGVAEPDAAAREAFRRQVEDDWLLRERFRRRAVAERVGTACDAAGGCDGVKNGGYGFHTGLAERPWWQVDLGAEHALGRIVVWNRTDGASERAARLHVLVSPDGAAWHTVYRHGGGVFGGVPDQAPLSVDLGGVRGRVVRIQLPETTFLHLDEVEVFSRDDPATNLALRRPADQVSVSQWSVAHREDLPVDWPSRVDEIIAFARRLAAERAAEGVDVASDASALDDLARRLAAAPREAIDRQAYFEARWVQRRLVLSNPLLDFERILFVKRVPGSFNHMSDQHLGWWSLPGGGIYILEGFTRDAPSARCISSAFTEPGSFQRPELSYDARRVLFAWARYREGLADEPNKLDKGNVPEDAFYHIYEMAIEGTQVRRLTHGKYDDFDGRYLPDGRIVFLSTRRGQAVQPNCATAAASLRAADLPDIYVRCGGGPERPCVVYTLHTMEADGSGLYPISPFEMFEWTPTVAHDGTILFSRWDYVDRDNMPYMGLWAMNPDGTNPRIVYGNFTLAPHCAFEARSIPGSSKIVFTGSAHHAQTKGSLVLVDPARGTEGDSPITRLTPEVDFPEAESWPLSYYAGPWPLSERFHLCTWGAEGVLAPATTLGWNRWHSVPRPRNGMGIYFFDAEGAMELLYRDPDIACFDPIPLVPRPEPFRLAARSRRDAGEEGRFLLVDVYAGFKTVARGEVTALRIVAVPPKTHPTMDYPAMGITRDDPGKCVLGTVPVEPDGSAYFRAPAGVTLFFQALDSRGQALQTMRSATHVQPGETLSCIGCHEARSTAPPAGELLAALREPSRIATGPEGSWPLRFDRLVGPVLEAHCVSCHGPGGEDARARAFDLTAAKAYETLTAYGSPSAAEFVMAQYRQGFSTEGTGVARESALLRLLTAAEGHAGVVLDEESIERFVVWLDTYAQRLGSFSAQQEQELMALRARWRPFLEERAPPVVGYRRALPDAAR